MYTTARDRLNTFEGWESSSVSKESLAEAGFWYIGPSDTVKCFICNVEIGDWEVGADPKSEHLKYSPNCPFMGELTTPGGVQFNTTNVPEMSDVQVRSAINEGFRKLYNKYRFSDARQIIRKKLSEHEQKFRSSNATPAEQIIREHLRNEAGGMNRRGDEEMEAVLPVSPAPRLQGHSVTSTAFRPTTEGQNGPEWSTIHNNASSNEEQPKDFCHNPDTVANAARHPEYANIVARLGTFSSWPRSHVCKPKDLVEAGFYFTGSEDRVRCFVCNGGLCNWNSSDVPWFEHARWYGNCLYVQDCQRHPVVAAIIETAKQIDTASCLSHHEHQHQHQGQTQCDVETEEQEANTELDENATENGASARPAGTDLESMKQENEDLKSSRVCKLCMDAPVGVIFLPCSHLVTCLDCSLQLDKCPLCRAEIKGRARVFI